MTELAAEIDRARTNARAMAHSLGVRVFLYQDAAGKPVFRPLRPAERDENLSLVEEFAPPEPTRYEGTLPSSPPSS
jgi:hypothetical protein